MPLHTRPALAESDFIPLRDYQASTPLDFDLQESLVLYHKEVQADVRVSPATETFAQENFAANLYITASAVLLSVCEGPKDSGNELISIPYKDLSLHAIQRDPQCVYLQIQDPDMEDMFIELFVTPQRSESIVQLYNALSECASLHPDPDSEDEDTHEDLVATLQVDPQEYELDTAALSVGVDQSILGRRMRSKNESPSANGFRVDKDQEDSNADDDPGTAKWQKLD